MQLGVHAKPLGLSAAARSAEQLFETKNVADIREIEARTRKDIEGKSLQLRQLVGDSYRDLIEGSENIVDIHTKCKSILQNVNGLQESFAKLALGVTRLNNAAPSAQDPVRKHAELHSVGGRVRYLLDTPEVLWGCLDSRQFMAAARRLLRAHVVHEALRTRFPGDVLAKFPLLTHQWPLVTKFRQQILDIVGSSLTSDAGLSVGGAADAVAALSALEGLTPAAALQRFLDARLQLLQAQLEAAAAAAAAAATGGGGGGSEGVAGQAPLEPVSGALATAATAFQTTIAQVGQLFLAGGSTTTTTTTSSTSNGTSQRANGSNGALDGVPSSGTATTSSSSSTCLQQAVEEEAADASELYFGAAYGLGEGAASPEALAWGEQQRGLMARLAPLAPAQVSAACTAWVAQAAAVVAAAGGGLLASCTDAAALLAVQASVLDSIATWSSAGSSGSSSDARDVPQGSTAVAAGRGKNSGLVAGRDLRAAAAGGASGGSSSSGSGRPWAGVCQEVLGRPLSVWQALFKAPFLERAQHLITTHLARVGTQVEGPLAATLAEAAAAPPQAPGRLAARPWPAGLPPGLAAALAGGAAAGGRLPRSFSLGVAEATSHRDTAPQVCQLFDEGLRGALQEALRLMTPPADSPSASAPAPASRAASLAPPAPSSPLRASAGGAAAAGAFKDGGRQPAAAAAAAAAEAAAAWDRAAELQPYVQQQCLAMVRELAAHLEQRLVQLGAPAAGVKGAAAVEQVLLVARVCSCLAGDSALLPALLGPPAGWKAAAAGGGGAGGAGGGAVGAAGRAAPGSLWGPAGTAAAASQQAGAQAQQLAAVQAALRQVATQGYVTWAAWAAQGLIGDMGALLAEDPVLRSTAVPLSWVETKVGGGDGVTGGLDAGDDEAIRFSLPAAASPAVLTCLMQACWEAERAGGHAITTSALQLLAWELQAAVLTTLAALPLPGSTESTNGQTLTDKGVLQLLFDQRLVADVLLGGRPLEGVDGSSSSSSSGALGVPGQLMGAPGAGGAAAGGGVDPQVGALLAGRRKQVVALEQQLQDQLDPIDWATYEHHLWANVRTYYRRVAVLLGALAQLERAHPEAPPAAGGGKPAGGGGSAEINVLNILPVAPRFQYLPISMPVNKRLTSVGSGGLVSMGSGSLEGAAAAAAAGGAGGGLLDLGAPSKEDAADLAAQYSLADLGTALAASTARAAAEEPAGAGAGFLAAASAAGDMAGAGASALSALQARLQAGGGFSALGSILGDKAAEVSAMAAQGLGDFLPGGASSMLGASGLLSSFTSKSSPFAAASGSPPGAKPK